MPSYKSSRQRAVAPRKTLPLRTQAAPWTLPHWAWLAWIAAILASVLWSPFRLGFYLDDWPAILRTLRRGGPFSLERLQAVNAVDIHRPALALPRWIFSSLLGDSTIAWHCALIAASCLTAYMIGKTAATLWPGETSTRKLMYTIAACWIVVPWAIAFRIWPLFLAVQLGMAAFLGSMYLIVSGWTNGKTRLIVAACLYLFACLAYEVFFLQFIPVALIGLVLIRARRVEFKPVLYGVLALCAAQAGAFAWSLTAKALALSTRKSIQPGWTTNLGNNIRAIGPAVVGSLYEVRYLFAVAILPAAVLMAGAYWLARRQSNARISANTAAWLVACCGVGAGLSLVIFSMGGRIVSPYGVETRTNSLATVWLMIAASILGGFVRSHAPKRIQAGMLAAGVAVGACLMAGNVFRLEDWAAAWRRQNQVLRGAPIARMRQAPAGAVVVYVNELEVNHAPVFAAYWDIQAAVPLTYPETSNLRFVLYSHWLGPMQWDGSILEYANGYERQSAPVLYVWEARTQQFYRATKPVRVDLDLSVHPIE